MAEQVQDSGLELPPIASLLMQSLRAVGYTVQAALADLIDNSIAAGARTIEIEFDGASGQYVATVDDGCGMDEDTLVASMRFGSRDPRDARTGTDLGRFGPPALRPHLRRIVGEVTSRSRRVYTHKGTPRNDDGRVPLWRRHDGRDGAASWAVNREHPAVVALTMACRPEGERPVIVGSDSRPSEIILMRIQWATPRRRRPRGEDAPSSTLERMLDTKLYQLSPRLCSAPW